MFSTSNVKEGCAICVAAERRSSRRARKGRQPVKVNSSDTLAQLRLKVFEGMGIHPMNQKLYARGALLEGDEQTLAQVKYACCPPSCLIHCPNMT